MLQLVGVAVSAVYFVGCWCLAHGHACSACPARAAPVASVRPDRQGVVRWLVLEGVLSAISLIGGDDDVLYWLTGGATWTSIALLLTTLRDSRRRGIHDKLAGSLVIATR
ncbi:MAG: hypothetical protein U0667_08345 [Chloroflexota bacterium]